jgi:hypothetical protein
MQVLDFVLFDRQEAKIDSSAEALRVRHHPFYLSLQNQLCSNAV